MSVRGGPGFTFLWNRSYFHRASPNISPVRRRVLKLSIQPASLPNGRLLNDELVGARHQVGDDPWLHALLGGPSIADRSPLTSTAAVATHPVVPNDEVELRPIQVATYHAAELARSVRRWARPA